MMKKMVTGSVMGSYAIISDALAVLVILRIEFSGCVHESRGVKKKGFSRIPRWEWGKTRFVGSFPKSVIAIFF